MAIPLSWSAWEQETNRLNAARVELLSPFSSESLFEIYSSFGLGRPTTTPLPDDCRRFLEQLAVPTIVAELRRRSELEDLEAERPL